MPSSRIFVSYACIGDEQGARVGKQLVSDIRATQTEAVADHETISDERFISFLNQELPQCGYLVVVQTPVAVQSWRVQKTLALARTLVEHQRMRAVLCVIAAPAPQVQNHPLWEKLFAVDASMDYPRAREKLFLALNLVHVDTDESFIVQRLSPLPKAAGSNWSAQPSSPIARPAGSNWASPPSSPMVRAAGNNWSAHPSGPIARPVGSEWLAHPSVPVSPPVGSEWAAPPSSPMSMPGGSNWPAQPPAPMVRPMGSNWPAQPGSPGPMPRPAAPVSAPGSPASRLPGSSTFSPHDGFVVRRKKTWPSVLARFARPLRTSQTSISAHSSASFIAGAPTFLEDRPQSLHPRRRMLIRWVIAIGILLVLILAATLIVLLVRSHLHH